MKEVLLTSSVLILALLALRRVFRRAISRRTQYALWGLVLLRLLVPVNLPAMEHNVLTAAEPVGAQVSEQLEQQKVYILPTGQVDLPEASQRNPELRPGYEMAPTSTGIMVVDKGGDTATVYAGWMTKVELLRCVWCAGIAVMAAWLLISNLRFWRRLRKGRTPYSAEGCKYPVYLCAGLPSPCLFGLFRPAIYLTPAAAETPERLRHVLAHEYTHARHGDPLWSALRCVCLAVYWFNPLVWAAAYASKTDCELACDEGAMKLLGVTERIPYGRTLLSLIPVRRVSNPLLSATTMTAGKRQLKDRIARIAENRQTKAAALFLVLALAAVVCAATFTGAKKPAGPAPLTQEELAGFNEDMFGDGENAAFHRQFLTSLYEKPEDINLYQLFYNGTGQPGIIGNEERQALVDAYFAGEGPEVDLTDLTKLPAGEMDQILERYIGLTLAETSQIGLDSFDYLENYDAYYHFHGDTNAFLSDPYSFAAGEREGDLVKLYYQVDGMFLNDDFPEGWACLTLREVPGEFEDGFPYRFVSHQLCQRPEHLLGQPQALTGEELKFFNEEFFNNDTVNGTVGINIHNQFLTSLYAKPEDIDLFELFYCGTGLDETMTEEEWHQVGSFGSDGEEICPTDKLSIENMDRVLLENTGLTLMETHQTGLEYFQYLPEYNAYYHSHGDTNYFHSVQIIAGTRENSTIRLYYPDSGARYDCDWLCVTLRERVDGTYWFVSNQPSEKPAISTTLPEGEPVLTIPLTGLAPYEPETVAVERHSNDCAVRGGGWLIDAENGSSVSLRPYLSTDGSLYAAILFDEVAGRNGPTVWEAGCFFTFPSGNSITYGESTVQTSFFNDLFGHSGWQVSYEGHLDEHAGTTFTDYYYFQDETTPVLLARTHGLDPTVIDLDGDGANELVNADNQLFFQREGKLYEADITALLEEHWPEMTWWDYTILDTDSRCLVLRGFVEMPEWGENGQANFLRYVYFDGESLLVYDGLEETEDHAALSVLRGSIPEQVLSDGKAAAQADYDYVKQSKDSDWFQIIDDWRVSYLKQAGTFTEFSCGPIEVYSLGYQFHAAEPGKVVLAGGMYVQEDGWVGGFNGFLKDSAYLVYQVREDGSRVRLESYIASDCSPGAPMFTAGIARSLVEAYALHYPEVDPEVLAYMFCDNGYAFLNDLGEENQTEQMETLDALCRWALTASEEDAYYFDHPMENLANNPNSLTAAGRSAYSLLLSTYDRLKDSHGTLPMEPETLLNDFAADPAAFLRRAAEALNAQDALALLARYYDSNDAEKRQRFSAALHSVQQPGLGAEATEAYEILRTSCNLPGPAERDGFDEAGIRNAVNDWAAAHTEHPGIASFQLLNQEIDDKETARYVQNYTASLYANAWNYPDDYVSRTVAVQVVFDVAIDPAAGPDIANFDWDNGVSACWLYVAPPLGITSDEHPNEGWFVIDSLDCRVPERFQDILGAPSEELLHQTILDYRSSRTAHRSDFTAEAHEVLDTAVSENGRQYTFYTLVYYNTYSITDGAWKIETGGRFPAVITFAAQQDGSWTLSDYQEERQGGDIARLFPADVAERIYSEGKDISAKLAAQCDAAAEAFAAAE